MAKSSSTQQMNAKEIAEFIAEEVRSITGACVRACVREPFCVFFCALQAPFI